MHQQHRKFATGAKIIHTERLIELSERAADKYTRSIAEEAYDRLDPDGIHIAADTAVSGGMGFTRATVLMKFADVEAPQIVFLDMDHEDWIDLMSAKRYLELAEVTKLCPQCGQPALHSANDYICTGCRNGA